jgi:putative oxidoreductase
MLAAATKLADRLQPPLLLGLRLLFGVSFLTLGIAKLGDVQGYGEVFAGYGLPLPVASAALAGLAEALGGLLLAVGVAARPAGLVLAGTMVVALLTAHRGEAWLQAKPAPYLVAALVVLAFGAGPWSVDAWLSGDVARKPPA